MPRWDKIDKVNIIYNTVSLAQTGTGMNHWITIVLVIVLAVWIANLIAHADQLSKNPTLIKKYREGKFDE